MKKLIALPCALAFAAALCTMTGGREAAKAKNTPFPFLHRRAVNRMSRTAAAS